jgi:putative radical SAM enzyme (TIGR03279 family)
VLVLKIKSVKPGSIGQQLRLKPGDEIISLNGSQARDIIDYFFHSTGEELAIRVRTTSGKLIDFEIEKGYDEDIGLEVEIPPRHCQNNCLFCFIDQQPPGLRKTLYIKDDDYRLSFLEGNYISLTNLQEEDITRIIREKLSPLYISVHSTDPHIRGQLMGRKSSSDISGILRRFAAEGIAFHCQIVLCPGINDDQQLVKTIADLSSLGESLLSLAVVPVGLTKYRKDLTPLIAVDRESAVRTIEIIDRFQEMFITQQGRQVVYGADEFYVKAELPVPEEEYYEDYPQLENGVGMIRKTLLQAEALRNLPKLHVPPYRLLLVTGKAARATMEVVSDIIVGVRPGLNIKVLAVENYFLGPEISVAGLLAGADISRAVSSVSDTWDGLVVPEAAVRAGCFLDDWTQEKLAHTLDKTVHIAEDLMDIIKLSGNGEL